MGLDMYLERHHKAVEGYLRQDLEEVGYWRKANAIHHWFVENVQDGVDDCGRYTVTKEQLEDLLDACERSEYNNNASEILPTHGGFFFGSTDYDEFYYQDIENTIKILNKVLKETDFDNYNITYTSSW